MVVKSSKETGTLPTHCILTRLCVHVHVFNMKNRSDVVLTIRQFSLVPEYRDPISFSLYIPSRN